METLWEAGPGGRWLLGIHGQCSLVGPLSHLPELLGAPWELSAVGAALPLE